MNIKMNRRVALGTLAVASLVSSIGMAHADALDDIRKRGRILVAVDIGHPPYGMLNEKAEQTGLDIDTAKLLAKDLGVNLQVVPVSGASRVPFLLSRKADIVVSSFSITEDRKKVIDFSEPYGVIPVVVLGPKSANVTSTKDMDGQSVAVARGTTTDFELGRVAKEAGVDVRLVRYEDEATATTAVGTGQQDYLSASLATAQAVAKQNPRRDLAVKYEISAFPMAIGLRQNEPELKSWVDEWVVANLRNGKLNEIYKTYFNESLPKNMLER